jgi:hypothetical protein
VPNLETKTNHEKGFRVLTTPSTPLDEFIRRCGPPWRRFCFSALGAAERAERQFLIGLNRELSSVGRNQ